MFHYPNHKSPILGRRPRIFRKEVSFLNECSDDEIHCICEACYNILDGNIPMNKNNKLKLKNKLIPIKNEIRKLGNSKISVKTKRKLLAIP